MLFTKGSIFNCRQFLLNDVFYFITTNKKRTISTDELETNYKVTSLVETEHKRIASINDTISVFSYNSSTKKWKKI